MKSLETHYNKYKMRAVLLLATCMLLVPLSACGKNEPTKTMPLPTTVPVYDQFHGNLGNNQPQLSKPGDVQPGK